MAYQRKPKEKKKKEYEWVETKHGRPVFLYKDGKIERFNKKNITQFDLVEVLYNDESKQIAWWMGTGWDSRKPLKNKPIIAWRRFDCSDFY